MEVCHAWTVFLLKIIQPTYLQSAVVVQNLAPMIIVQYGAIQHSMDANFHNVIMSY